MANKIVKTEELLHYGTARPITYPGNGTGARKEDLDAMDSHSYLKYFGSKHRMTQEQLIEYTKKRKAEQKTKKETDEVKEELEASKNGSSRPGPTFSGGGTSARKEDLDAMDPRSYLKYFGGTHRMTQEQLAEYTEKIKKKNAKHSAISEVAEPNELKHYTETCCDSLSSPIQVVIPEVDKSKSISEMTTEELRRLIDRLRNEREAEDYIRVLRRSAGMKDSFENPAKVDTKTPVEQLYHKDTDEFLAHHGILGMKWGFRRFQNKDGSRTAAGKKREAEQEKSEDYVKTRESRKKGSASLSNEELRRINERLQLEATFKTLTTEKMDKAESFVGKAIKNAAGSALQTFASGIMLGAGKSMLKQLSPEFAGMAFSDLKPEKPAQTNQNKPKK